MFRKIGGSRVILLSAALLVMGGRVAWAAGSAAPPAMHIMEGFLPPLWAAFWYAVMIPFWAMGYRAVRNVVTKTPEMRLLLGLVGAFTFVLSALKIPSVTGSSSHPTGTGLGAVIFGPWMMAIIGTIVLLFQALLIAHGGLTTLGANAFSMAVVGPLVAYIIWRGLRGRLAEGWVVFLAAALADLITYVVTSTQLALAYPDQVSGFVGAFAKFATIFAVTQIPLAISEGILTVLIFKALRNNAATEMRSLGLEGV